MIYETKSDSFELKDIFDCGQCFRWNEEDDGSYTGVFTNCVLNVEKKNNKIIFNGTILNDENNQKSFEEKIKYYFDLDRDYSKIKNTLAKVDKNLRISIEYGSGIRILNQELFETIISFIISANNNIPRIKAIVEKIAKKYGRRIVFDGKEYYTFPSPKELSKASVSDLRSLGMGFRDIRVYETTQMINNQKIKLDQLNNLHTNEARNSLLTLPGVGPKVADCILLFSTLKRFDVFPIDVWVRRVMNELYIHDEDEKKVNKNEIQKIANEKFGGLQGLAQQYLFYWKREDAS